jgi:hypothetical protein
MVVEQKESLDVEQDYVVVEQRGGWAEAGWIFALSRLMIILISYRAIILLPISRGSSLRRYIITRSCSTRNITCFVESWWRWDVVRYVEVAHFGYAYNITNTVFFPLFPFLEHYLASFFGGSTFADYVAGMVITNVCFYAVLILFYQLVYQDFGHDVAKNALIYLTFAPYAIFFFAGYAESLFFLLSLAVFAFLRRGKPRDWWLAGICGFLAALTRPTGVILVVPFLVLGIQRFGWRTFFARENWWQKLSAFLSMALIPLGLLLYMLVLRVQFGNPFLFSTEQAKVWSRHIAFPWVGMYDAIQALYLSGYDLQRNLADLFFTILPLLVLIIGWKRLPLHYSLYSLVMVLFVLCFPVMNTGKPLMSAPRHLMMIFPVFIIMAISHEKSNFARMILIVSIAFFAINIIFFVTEIWVA